MISALTLRNDVDAVHRFAKKSHAVMTFKKSRAGSVQTDVPNRSRSSDDPFVPLDRYDEGFSCEYDSVNPNIRT